MPDRHLDVRANDARAGRPDRQARGPRRTYAAAMHAVENGGDLAQVAAERGLLTEDQIRAATDPRAALGSATDFVDRVLAAGGPR